MPSAIHGTRSVPTTLKLIKLFLRGRKAGDDWGPAVQAAIDSGARVVYFPKTEDESQKLLAEAGAATEILGAFIYPLGKIPADRPIFENRDSRIALVYGTSVYHANHKLHILDVRGTQSKTVGNDALQWAGSRARMDLYTSDDSQP